MLKLSVQVRSLLWLRGFAPQEADRLLGDARDVGRRRNACGIGLAGTVDGVPGLDTAVVRSD